MMAIFNFNPDFPDATEAQKLRQVRLWRNSELARTDWTQVADAPVDALAWAVYRQALRDLPATIDIANPVLPDPPGGE
jgi:phage tail protein X